MEITFANMGKSLGTRVLGQEIRHKIEDSLSRGERVIFNFSGVRLVSHSFADECFAKLLLIWDLDQIKSMTTFVEANDFVKKTVSFTMRERMADLELAH